MLFFADSLLAFIHSKYDNESKIKEFIDKVDIVTFEFENIPIDILKKIKMVI